MPPISAFVFVIGFGLVLAYFRWRREERFAQRLLEERDEKFFERYHR